MDSGTSISVGSTSDRLDRTRPPKISASTATTASAINPISWPTGISDADTRTPPTWGVLIPPGLLTPCTAASSASAIRYAAGAVGPANDWSVVDRLTSIVEPASTCSAVAGRSMLTVSGLPSAGRLVNRIGATAPPASVLVPPADTLDSEPYSTAPSSWEAAAPAVPAAPAASTDAGIGSLDTVTVTRGVPVMTVRSPKGAESKCAVWPGRPPAKVDSAVDASPDNPGRLEMEPGEAPGGFTTDCGSPLTGIDTRLVVVPSARPG